jgi:hypothetical protein
MAKEVRWKNKSKRVDEGVNGKVKARKETKKVEGREEPAHRTVP